MYGVKKTKEVVPSRSFLVLGIRPYSIECVETLQGRDRPADLTNVEVLWRHPQRRQGRTISPHCNDRWRSSKLPAKQAGRKQTISAVLD